MKSVCLILGFVALFSIEATAADKSCDAVALKYLKQKPVNCSTDQNAKSYLTCQIVDLDHLINPDIAKGTNEKGDIVLSYNETKESYVKHSVAISKQDKYGVSQIIDTARDHLFFGFTVSNIMTMDTDCNVLSFIIKGPFGAIYNLNPKGCLQIEALFRLKNPGMKANKIKDELSKVEKETGIKLEGLFTHGDSATQFELLKSLNEACLLLDKLNAGSATSNGVINGNFQPVKGVQKAN